MKKRNHINKKSYLLISILIMILILGLGAFIGRSWLERAWYGYQVRHQLSVQLEPLRDALSTLGFSDLPQPKVSCETNRNESGKMQDSCSATIQKYIVVGSGPQVQPKLKAGAVWLSQRFDNNGWSQRKDLKTIAWFKAFGQGADYQPDQLNVKQVGDISCSVDFFTAFSKPAKPAVNLMAICQKPGIPNRVLGQNF